MEAEDITADQMIEWVRADPEKIREIMRAEAVVEHGKIELVYADGKYIGVDIQQRIRVKRC